MRHRPADRGGVALTVAENGKRRKRRDDGTKERESGDEAIQNARRYVMMV